LVPAVTRYYRAGEEAVMKKKEQDALLESLAGIFIRCFFLAVALLLLWFFFYVLGGGEWSYSINSPWSTLSRHDYDLLNYSTMAFVKMCAILFFLFPYLAIRMVLRKKKEKR
jgi:hypothetical protein